LYPITDMVPVQNDIFQILSSEQSDGKVTAQVSINKDSEIFTGHFPDEPVVPGACILQLVKDVLEDAFKKPLLLRKASHLKFISMIIPEDDQEATLELIYKTEEDVLQVTAKLSTAHLVCFKFQGSFVI
jgi:3-hydroxyacyl-[acyl-carrier-protein] dehydratase